MSRLIRADMLRLGKSPALRLSLGGMLLLAVGFLIMQATGMDYTVPLSRVIFLPLSLYGIVMGAFVSVFVGTDFSDGFIRNKLLTVRRRESLVLSQSLVSAVGCALIYLVVTAFSAGVGRFFFEKDVEPGVFFRYLFLGLGMSLALGVLFCVITLLAGHKTRAVVWCMGLAMGMLLLALHTNQVLMQEPLKEGVLNPAYVTGIKRLVYELLHDLNPCGQAAQLSAWRVSHPPRLVFLNLFQTLVVLAGGCALFRGKDIR